MPVYGYQSVVQSVPTGNSRVRFFGGRATRVSLLVSSTVSALIRISPNGGSDDGSLAVMIRTDEHNALPFKDYGPVIQGEIWVSHTNAAPATISLTEVYFITRCS